MEDTLISKLRKQVQLMEQITRVNPSVRNKEDLEYFQRKLQRALDSMEQK